MMKAEFLFKQFKDTKSYKKMLGFIVVSSLTLMCLVNPVSAHVLESDGTIGAVLHIVPDDSAVSGSPTVYELTFKDTNNKFSLEQCGCRVSVIKSGTSIFTHTLTATNMTNTHDSYTFKDAGVYTLKIDGTPKGSNTFSPFSLSYTIRVQSPTSTMSAQNFPILLGIGLVLVFGLIIVASYKFYLTL